MRSLEEKSDVSQTSHTPDPETSPSEPVLRIAGLRVAVQTPGGMLPVLRGVDLELHAGQTLTLLGESGSGKSITANAAIGVLPTPPFVVQAGSVTLDGQDLLALGPADRGALRGERIAMVFQDSMSALNPSYKVGWQIGEMLRVRRSMSRAAAKTRAIELLDQVRIPDPARAAEQYPHQFSGGMRQRAAIAMAIALDPHVLIADEPTTALDVTVQQEVLALLRDLQRDRNMSLLLITHDMGVAYEMSDRISVMYAGTVVESATSKELFETPAHPYSGSLMDSVPLVDAVVEKLAIIEGSPPDLGEFPTGCAFHPRCWRAEEQCRHIDPPAVAVAPGHRSRCLFAQELSDG